MRTASPSKYNNRTCGHPRAYEATVTRDGILMVKAQKLRLNLREVTPANLARELRISVATLYRRYGREAVKHACQVAPVRDVDPAKSIYQIAEQSLREVEEAIANRIDKKDSDTPSFLAGHMTPSFAFTIRLAI